MARTNKYGRSDFIPADVKRQIRKRCGFGCVVCGSPFYDYEHWNPVFEELNSDPSPNGITLCCPSCHRIKGGLLSHADYVSAIQSPRALRDGFVAAPWSKGFCPEIVLGSVHCAGTTHIFSVDGETMLGFDPPEEPGAPPRLVAKFFNRSGVEVFRIDDNECVGNPRAWDITSTRISTGGWRWQIRHGSGEIDLVLELFPPSRIVVQRMVWQTGTLRLVATSSGVQLLQYLESKNAFENLVLVQGDCSVRALKPDHSFLAVTRKYYVRNYSIPTFGVRFHIAMTNTELKAEPPGGIFSLGPDAKLR